MLLSKIEWSSVYLKGRNLNETTFLQKPGKYNFTRSTVSWQHTTALQCSQKTDSNVNHGDMLFKAKAIKVKLDSQSAWQCMRGLGGISTTWTKIERSILNAQVITTNIHTRLRGQQCFHIYLLGQSNIYRWVSNHWIRIFMSRNWQYKDVYRKAIHVENQHCFSILEGNCI